MDTLYKDASWIHFNSSVSSYITHQCTDWRFFQTKSMCPRFSFLLMVNLMIISLHSGRKILVYSCHIQLSGSILSFWHKWQYHFKHKMSITFEILIKKSRYSRCPEIKAFSKHETTGTCTFWTSTFDFEIYNYNMVLTKGHSSDTIKEITSKERDACPTDEQALAVSICHQINVFVLVCAE